MQINGPLKRAMFEELASDPVGVELVVGRLWKITSQNVFRVYDGTAIRTFADLDSAQTFQNKTLNEATFTQIATPANPSAGFSKLYPKTDGKFYTLDSLGNEAAVGSGSGGGVDNLVVNGSADDTASSIFVPYADAAGTRPVDGTGGAPTVTTAITTTNPLNKTKSFTLVKPASNVQGQGWSVPFDVPLAYRAKSIKISTKYILDSGTFVPGSQGIDGDVIVYLYDITNSTLIEPSNIKLLSNSATLSDVYEATFQTSPTGSQYRLIFHVASTSALAYTLKVDDVTVSPQVYVYGTPVTDWQSWTPTGTWTTNTTYTGMKRRVGDTMEYIVAIALSGAPNATQLFVNLQESIDLAKFIGLYGDLKTCGTVAMIDVGINKYDGFVDISSATQVRPLAMITSGAHETATPIVATTPFTFGNTDGLILKFAVPIVGLSSSVQMSDAADTRVVAANVAMTGTQAIANSTAANILLTTRTVEGDTHGSYNTSTGFYTVPVSGLYRAKIRTIVQSAVYANSSSFIGLNLKKNNSTLDTIAYYQAPAAQTLPNQEFKGDRLARFNAGDTIIVELSNSTGSSLTLTSGYIEFERISGPSAIAASEFIGIKYQNNAGTSVPSPNLVPVPYSTKIYDTHNSWNGTVFTAPAPGKYRVSCAAFFASGSWTATGTVSIAIRKNGAITDFLSVITKFASITSELGLNGSGPIDLLAGDTLEIRLQHNEGTARTLSVMATGLNWLSIEKID